MALYGQRGTLINAGGGIASSEGCCCDDVGPEEPPNPPPSGPDCGCDVFSNCTAQVVYDGLTALMPLNQLDSREYFKEAGVSSYRLTANFIETGTFGLSLSINARGICNSNKVQIVGTCGIPTISTLYHMSIIYGTTGFVPFGAGLKNRWQSYYRFNLDADASQPCPATRDGRAVSVSLVQRLPAFEIIPDPANCQLSCREALLRYKAELSVFFPFLEYVVRIGSVLWSYKWTSFAWATYSGGADPDPIRGAKVDPPDDEFWPCDLPIWATQHPAVTITCPP